MTVMEEERKPDRANVEQLGMVSTKADETEAMPLVRGPVHKLYEQESKRVYCIGL